MRFDKVIAKIKGCNFFLPHSVEQQKLKSRLLRGINGNISCLEMMDDNVFGEIVIRHPVNEGIVPVKQYPLASFASCCRPPSNLEQSTRSTAEKSPESLCAVVKLIEMEIYFYFLVSIIQQ